MNEAADPRDPRVPSAPPDGDSSRVTRAAASDETTAPELQGPAPADPHLTVAPEAAHEHPHPGDAARCYAACAGARADRQRSVGKALAALRAAVAAGYKDRVGLANDPHLTPLREEANYRELVKELVRR